MPSRLTFFSKSEYIKNRFQVDTDGFEFYEYYNMKPTNRMTGIIYEDGNHQLKRIRWGFVGGKKFFKARAETASEKRLFGKAMKERRCLIIANGFFEWDKDDPTSTPHYFTLKDEEAFAIGGLYNSSIDEESGETSYSAAILTIEANELVGEYFHRMPAIIPRKSESDWLKPETELEKIQSLLKPYPSEPMETWTTNPLPARGDNGPATLDKVKTTSLGDFF